MLRILLYKAWRILLSILCSYHIPWQVVISQMNGQDHPSQSIHVFHVGKMRIKLRKGWMTKAKEPYSSSMQVKMHHELFES